MKALDCAIIPYLFFNLLHKTLLRAFLKPKDIIYSFPLHRDERKSHKADVNYTDKEKGAAKEMLKKLLGNPKGNVTE